MVPDSSAILVRNAFKSYGKKPVLKDLSMHVERGTIYGLLGASGCGKTTLLSSIVGRKKLDSGEIWVLGGIPGDKSSGVPGPRVGYMPQDIALVAEFTVKDAVYYFGRILDMDDDLLEMRYNKLSRLLELPPDERFLKNCSGGQQRRVSFAAAMVHMPELLILDEPTVGLDPVLRDRIWEFLVDITRKEQMAVVITTHYIEEAKQSNKIGLMREGKLLAEESPSRLLSLFQKDTLEEVFLILSRRQELGQLTENNVNALVNDQNNYNAALSSLAGSTSTIQTFEIDHGSTDMLTKKVYKKSSRFCDINRNRLKALMDKNWKQFYRNITGVMFLILFPVIQSTCFFAAIGDDIRDINLAIVNDEMFTANCKNFSTNGTAIPINYSCHFHELSCRFLTYLDDPMINKVKYDSVNEAIEDVKHGKAVGVLYMSRNFSEALEDRLNKGKDTENDLGDSEIKVWMDMSNRQIGATIKYKLLGLYLDFQRDVFSDCKFEKKFADLPLNFYEYLYGAADEKYTIFVMPGVLVTLVFFMGTIMTSQIIITDRCEGVWDRSIVAGVTSLEITITHFGMQSCILIVQAIELMIVSFVVFQMDYLGNICLIWLIIYLQGICGMSYGFWISVISNNHTMANIMTTGSFMPMILICGFVWPLEAMPKVLMYFAKSLPFTITIDSLRNVIKKNWDITNFDVWDGIVISIAWTIFFLGISIFSIKKKR